MNDITEEDLKWAYEALQKHGLMTKEEAEHALKLALLKPRADKSPATANTQETRSRDHNNKHKE